MNEIRTQVQFIDIDEDMAGQRIDNFLRNQLKNIPKSVVYRILRKGEVRVNKKRVKAEYKLEAGDVVRVPCAGDYFPYRPWRILVSWGW